MRTITAKVSNPDFLTTYKFFSNIGDVKKLAISDKRIKVSLVENDDKNDAYISMDFRNSGKNVSFNRIHTHLMNYGNVSYFRLDDNVAVFRFSKLDDTFQAYNDLKRYCMSGLIKITFVSQ